MSTGTVPTHHSRAPGKQLTFDEEDAVATFLNAMYVVYNVKAAAITQFGLDADQGYLLVSKPYGSK